MDDDKRKDDRINDDSLNENDSQQEKNDSLNENENGNQHEPTDSFKEQEYTIEEEEEFIESEENQVDSNIDIKSEKRKERKDRKKLSLIALALVFSMIGGTIGSSLTYIGLNYINKTNTNGLNNLEDQKITINLNDETYYAVAVAEKARKWVVGVTTLRKVTSWRGEETEQGVGSGVIVNENGYILTNSHVVSDGNADEINVSLIDGSNETAEVLWNDTVLDLAIIKINRNNLPYAEFGDSDSLTVGEPVIAIGNPMSLDLDRTVTNGIISGLNRSLLIDNMVVKPLIQTNASINPGNSGGPLLNAKGEVIGINTAKMTSTEGLGFSIPINIALPIFEQLVKNGSAGGYMGIKYVSVNDYEQRMGVDLTAEYGIMIVETVDNSPSQKAGLEIGDIIIDVDGTKIVEQTDLIKKLYEYKPGDTIKIKFLRNNEEKVTDLTLEEKPKAAQ